MVILVYWASGLYWTRMLRSSPDRIRSFARILSDAGTVTTIRKTRGDDIDAACGQLAGEVVDRTKLASRQRRVIAVTVAR